MTGYIIDAVLLTVLQMWLSMWFYHQENNFSLILNNPILCSQEEELHISLSTDRVFCLYPEKKHSSNTEFISSLTPNGLPPYKLKLKVGAVVTLQQNFNSWSGLCNRARLRICAVYGRVFHFDILTGVCWDEQKFLPKTNLMNQKQASNLGTSATSCLYICSNARLSANEVIKTV